MRRIFGALRDSIRLFDEMVARRWLAFRNWTPSERTLMIFREGGAIALALIAVGLILWAITRF